MTPEHMKRNFDFWNVTLINDLNEKASDGLFGVLKFVKELVSPPILRI
jgi:hypothetical protein